jgi:hypothetical protein
VPSSPPSFLVSPWNDQRRIQGTKVRAAVAAIMQEHPGIDAMGVRMKLDAAALGRLTLPRKRAIQWHLRALRKGPEFLEPPLP